MKKDKKSWFSEDDAVLNKTTTKKIIFIAFIVIVMSVFIHDYTTVFGWLKTLWGIVYPFVLGACIAFLFNVPMRQIETRIFKKPFKGRRAVSYLLTLLFVLAIVVGAMFVIIPKIVETGKSIAADYTAMGGSLTSVGSGLVKRFPALEPYIKKIDLSNTAIIEQVKKWLTSGAKSKNLLSSATSVVSNVVSGVASVLIGFAFSIYVLFKKEALGTQIRKILYGTCSDRFADKFLDVSVLADKTFSNFVRGQCLEACILGLMFFITLTIFRMPYALLIAVLIAITALVPIFGSFIGAAVSFLLILMVSGKQALLFLVIFIVLQQIEGKLIYPHVVGSSVGLPSIWVLFAITVGGELMGVAGMVIFVPLCSVLYALFREFIHGKLKSNNVPKEKYEVPYRERVKVLADGTKVDDTPPDPGDSAETAYTSSQEDPESAEKTKEEKNTEE